jgi:actin
MATIRERILKYQSNTEQTQQPTGGVRAPTPKQGTRVGWGPGDFIKDPLAALAVCKRVADEGRIDAHLEYAKRVERGAPPIRQDLPDAREHYRLAAEGGDPTASFTYAVWAETGRGGPADPAEAAKYYKVLADGDNAEAMFKYARVLASGTDRATSAHYYKLAADKGHSDAQWCYGCLLEADEGPQVTLAGESAKFFKLSAEQNNPNGQYHYAKRLLRSGKPADTRAAVTLLERSVAANNGAAQYQLARVLDGWAGIPSDHRRAVTLYQQSASSGDADGLVAYADLLAEGVRVEKDEHGAIECYEKAANKGHPIGCLRLAATLGPADRTRAVRLYRCAADTGNGDAQLHYARALELGDGIPADMEEAVKWYKIHAANGNADAQLTYAKALESDRRINPDVPEAVKWYELSAAQGNLEAELRYAKALEFGRGIGRDMEEAVKWYRRCADGGDVEGQLRLAEALNLGEGVERNVSEAEKYYKRAADQGRPEAQFAYANLLMSRDTSAKGRSEAVDYYERAAREGHGGAESCLERIRQEDAEAMAVAAKKAEDDRKAREARAEEDRKAREAQAEEARKAWEEERRKEAERAAAEKTERDRAALEKLRVEYRGIAGRAAAALRAGLGLLERSGDGSETVTAQRVNIAAARVCGREDLWEAAGRIQQEMMRISESSQLPIPVAGDELGELRARFKTGVEMRTKQLDELDELDDIGRGRRVDIPTDRLVWPGLFDDDVRTLVVDNGSHWCKVGFAGEETPSSTDPSLVGHLRWGGPMDAVVGDAALSRAMRSGPLIQDGRVTNWEHMVKLWQAAFPRRDLSDHPVLLTEAPLSPIWDREKAMEVIFETFGAPLFYVANRAALPIYTSRSTTGVVLDVGDDVTFAVPVYNGHVLPGATVRCDLGGSDITAWFRDSLFDRDQTIDLGIARTIKERIGYVAFDFEAEMRRFDAIRDLTVPYPLTDTAEIRIGRQRCEGPELLFGRGHDGIGQAVVDAIMKCDIDIRGELFENVVLAGATTMFIGLRERLEKEIGRLGRGMRVKVVAPPDRRNSSWFGGSIFASLPAFPQMVITRSEYNELGGRGILRCKCF